MSRKAVEIEMRDCTKILEQGVRIEGIDSNAINLTQSRILLSLETSQLISTCLIKDCLFYAQKISAY